VPVIKDLETDHDVVFRVATGPYEMPNVPLGFEDYVGPPPNPEFFSSGVINDVLITAKNTISAQSPESTCRNTFRVVSEASFHESVVESIALLNRIIDEEGPFDALIGLSEGGLMASTLLHARMQRDHQTTGFKCALFFNGFPPFSPDGSKVILADECGEQFRLPTLHVLGSDDPLVWGCIALYNLCNPENRVMVETGTNHVILWDQVNLVEIPKAVRKFVSGVLG